jgi:hypothetical protein
MKTRTALSLILIANGIITLILLIAALVLLYQNKSEEAKAVFGGFGIMGFFELFGLVCYFLVGRGQGQGRTALQLIPLMPHTSHRFDVNTTTSTAV